MKKEVKLTAIFSNKSTYVYYGKNKTECKNKLISKFGDTKGFKLIYS